ncbi:terminase small subunit [Exiguobacterium sp. AB2]|uniref:terminase small subunit n=1 Tax=Exiguobacterium sp. AB2 TaxID=1484479 RepID=UPI0004A955BB|nr:terminase small subunit [Exiguobacterium sp. AB2]KDN58460.1 hypothetical protein DI14_04810 [Exiguobacterium sp. AB2]
MGLNPKQQRFCDEYLVSLNATQAAIKAGYSEKTAGAQGSRLLKDVNVRKYIGGKQRETFLENTLTREEVLSRLSDIAAGKVPEIKEVVTRKAEYIPNENDPEGKKMTMVYNEYAEMIPLPTKNSDRNKALELLGRHYALFTDRKEVEHSGAVQFIDDIGGDDG